MLLNDVRTLLITVQLQLSLYEGCCRVYKAKGIMTLADDHFLKKLTSILYTVEKTLILTLIHVGHDLDLV